MQEAVDRMIETAEAGTSWAAVEAAAANVAAHWEATLDELRFLAAGVELAQNQLDLTLGGLVSLTPGSTALVPRST